MSEYIYDQSAIYDYATSVLGLHVPYKMYQLNKAVRKEQIVRCRDCKNFGHCVWGTESDGFCAWGEVVGE